MLEEGVDFYYIDGGYMVFTEEYHLKRGYCCANSCKHCPWRKNTGKQAIKTISKKPHYK